MGDQDQNSSTTVPARQLNAPDFLSDMARAFLQPQPQPAAYPELSDVKGWRDYVAAMDQSVLPMLRRLGTEPNVEPDARSEGGARIYDILPDGADPEARSVILEIHGGGLILCGGELCRIMGINAANRFGQRVWAVDYRMPPDHPFPAGLDDCVAAYRALLKIRSPREIVVSGASGGGNLAAALMLRIKAEGLPMPTGLVLGTPEVDLTESGDSFITNEGVDPGLHSLMPANLLYANGHDLTDPFLSPLFGDVSGFPPTILTTGTRDLYLSNTVRMHRKLRAADVPAELHLTEAGPHTGFPGSPEGAEIDREVVGFVKRVLGLR